ncbi:hypothetical protein AB0950_11920 [Streptomyces sp. NPDC007189]|uniref:hypothetical protein n=1 Tax=unclassified Streptomyces TaxID=2593676 RepID=UPI0033DE8DD3
MNILVEPYSLSLNRSSLMATKALSDGAEHEGAGVAQAVDVRQSRLHERVGLRAFFSLRPSDHAVM